MSCSVKQMHPCVIVLGVLRVNDLTKSLFISPSLYYDTTRKQTQNNF